MTPEEIARRRLAAQHLVDPPAATPADVVRRLGVVQAQDYPGAKWAIGLRARGCVDGVVERAMTDGSIVRTHVLRPTWHFVAPEDVRWMLALTAPRIRAAMASYDRKLGLDGTIVRRSNAAIEHALRGGTQLTRAELAQALRRARVDVAGAQQLAHLVTHAELDAIVCSGARRGKQFTYALLDERVPPSPPRDRDESLLELARRYFATRSPATVADFAWWSGLRMADARRAIELAGPALERRTIGERAYWLDPATPDPPPARRRTPAAHLLPNYDEYFIGFKDRGAIGQRLRSAQLVTGGNALISNVVVVDGQLVGGWRRAVGDDGVAIALTLEGGLAESERRAVDRAVAAYGAYLELPVRGARSAVRGTARRR